jgi:hypothetical protein
MAYCYPEYAWQGSKYLQLHQTVAERTITMANNMDIAIFCGPYTGKSYLSVIGRTGSKDTAQVFLGIDPATNKVSYKRKYMVYDTLTVDSTKAPQNASKTGGWVNENNIKVSDNQYAVKKRSTSTGYLFGTKILNYKPNSAYDDTAGHPLNWLVKGISVTVEGHIDTSVTASHIVTIYLCLNGSIIGSPKNINLKYFNDTTVVAGSDTDSWSASLTYANVKDTTFGVAIYRDSSVSSYGWDSLYIDQIQLEAYVVATNRGTYTSGSWTDTATTSCYTAYFTDYHKLEIAVINDSSRLIVDGKYLCKFPFGWFKYLSIGNEGNNGRAFFDCLVIRKYLSAQPHFYITRSPEDILGSEIISANYARRLKILDLIGE